MYDAEMVTPEEIECPLPPSPLSNTSDSAVYSWNISVSNDGQSFSNQFQFTVYDSNCLECDCSGQCQIKVCIIHYGSSNLPIWSLCMYSNVYHYLPDLEKS